VVLATHSDVSLKLLAAGGGPTPAERDVLEVMLHTRRPLHSPEAHDT